MSEKSPKQSQLAKFKEAAKQVETDNSEERFDRALKRVASTVKGKEEKSSKSTRTR